MVELAIDVSNGLNQQYLFVILIAVARNFKPKSVNSLFKDLD